jgi:hypothetical protein
MVEFRPPERRRGARLAFALVLPLILVVPFAFLVNAAFGATRIRYVVEPGVLRIETGAWPEGDKTVPLASVRERRVVTLRGGSRTMGTALPGFCVGRFSYPDLGAVWQATDCGPRAVLLASSALDRPVLVSPPDLDAFERELASPTGAVIALPTSDGGLRVLLAAAALLVLASAGAVVVLAVRGPRAMRYVVGDGALEVRTAFSRKRFLLAGARAKPYAAKLTWKIAGTGLPGYVTGLFREAGQTTRVYATETERGVLIEGPARLFLSPADRGGFLRALRDEGAAVDEAG